MTDSGYPLEWFVESLDAYLICGICGQVLRDPRATECGHVFCHRCLSLWIDEYGICPARCGEVELESLRRAAHISKKISCLLTRCRYTKAGCKAILQLSDKESHERKCHYAKKVVGKTRSFPFFNFGTASLSQPDEPSRHHHHHQHHSRSKSVHRSQLVRSSASDGEKDRRSTLQGSQLLKHKRSHSLGIGGIRLLSKKAPSLSVVNQPKIPKPMVSRELQLFLITISYLLCSNLLKTRVFKFPKLLVSAFCRGCSLNTLIVWREQSQKSL